MVSQQQFRLKWNNHRNTVLQEFGNLLNKNFFVDCIVGAEGKYLNAHKIVLSACSPYFQNIFSEHFDKHPVILLKDVLFSELKCLLDYMYNGEVNISECDLPSFLRTAQSLKIKGLAEDISDYDSASDSEPAPVGSYAENGRAVEANVEIHDDDGPPAAKKSSAPYLLSSAAKSANDSIAGRKRKSPSSPVPSHGKSNSQARVSVVSSAAAAAPAKPSEVSNNAVTDADASSQCSAAREEAASDDGGDSSRKASSLSDHREPSKRTEVKEEPVDNEVDLDDNSSYECGNNAGEENDALNEDSESNCANSGNKFNELSIASVSSFSENDANDRLFIMKQNEYVMKAISPWYYQEAQKLQPVNYSFNYGDCEAGKNAGANEFVCDACGKSYNRKGNLGRHKRYECGKGRQFQCMECPKSFFRKDKLCFHVKMCHQSC